MNRYLYEYDTQHNPAMPVVAVAVANTDAEAVEQTVLALIDSGADGSMFPQQLLQQIEAEYVRTVTMRGVVGIKVPVDVFVVRLRIGAIVLPGVRVIADSQNQEPILGRNVLNQLLVSLNGPGLLTTIEEV